MRTWVIGVAKRSEHSQEYNIYGRGAPAWFPPRGASPPELTPLPACHKFFLGTYVKKISTSKLFVSKLGARPGDWTRYRFAQIE